MTRHLRVWGAHTSNLGRRMSHFMEGFYSSSVPLGKCQCIILMYQGADKSLAQPTYLCILFDVENISCEDSLVIYIYIYIYIYIHSINIPPIMIINRIYETQNLLSLQFVSFLVGLRT
jgi:hypothetical protein